MIKSGSLVLYLIAVPALAESSSTAIPTNADHALRSLPAASIIPAIRQERMPRRDQILCLALALYHEARRSNETRDRVAVAQVIYNRIQNSQTSVCATIWANGQFSWVRHGDITPREPKVWQDVQTDAVAFTMHRPPDITHGATLFYNPRLCHPAWAKRGEITLRLQHTYIRVESSDSY